MSPVVYIEGPPVLNCLSLDAYKAVVRGVIVGKFLSSELYRTGVASDPATLKPPFAWFKYLTSLKRLFYPSDSIKGVSFVK